MRKLLSVGVSVAVLLAVPLTACEQQPTQLSERTQEASETEATANQGSSDDEVVTGTAVLRAVGTVAAEEHGFERGERVGTLRVTDDGMVTSVEGEASDLIPEHPFYGSLFYDKRSSVQGSPTSGEAAVNASACEPGIKPEDHPLHLTGGQMVISDDGTPAGLVGSWIVDGMGNATLEGETLEYVALEKIGTVSIRDFALASQVDSPDEFVVACGVVTRDPAN
jgi:hypothetical protein